MSDYDYTYKILMLGDATVGKTSLTIRYVSGVFLIDLKATIGVDFYSKNIIWKDRKIKLQIWDFGGEERFRFLLPQYCRGANGAFFLYDITNHITLDHLPDWTQIIREKAGDVPIALIGSKLDLNELRAIPREDGLLTTKMYNLSYFTEVSSKTGENVDNAFKTMVEIVYKKNCGSKEP